MNYCISSPKLGLCLSPDSIYHDLLFVLGPLPWRSESYPNPLDQMGVLPVCSH